MSLMDEFAEALSSEVMVDLDKLRELSRQGIPMAFRGQVWRYLLGINHADRSQEMSSERAKCEAYQSYTATMDPSISKLVRSDVHRYHRTTPLFQAWETSLDYIRGIFERVLAHYLQSESTFVYSPAWVNLLAPFAYCIAEESDVYYCFEAFMHQLDAVFEREPLSKKVANFMSLFRNTIPDLYHYFDEEEVDAKDWIVSWLQFVLAKELPLECLLRLWDTYFSEPEGFDLHPFVCLALLQQMKDALEELESSEICSLLQRIRFRPEDMDN
ncbi:hypothetical protein HMI55_001212, partial [Coelomomyces lativittatus]